MSYGGLNSANSSFWRLQQVPAEILGCVWIGWVLLQDLVCFCNASDRCSSFNKMDIAKCLDIVSIYLVIIEQQRTEHASITFPVHVC